MPLSIWFLFNRMAIPLMRLVRVWNLLLIASIQIIVSLLLKEENGTIGSLFFNIRIWLLLVATASTAAAGYIINDYYDIKIDAVNLPNRVVIDCSIRRRWALFIHAGLVLISLLCAGFLNWKYFLLFIFGNTLLWLYSNYLKRKPLVGNLSLGILLTGGIYAPALILKEPSITILLFAATCGMLIAYRSLLKDLRDIKGDQKFGLLTLPLLKGIRYTKRTLHFLAIVLLVFLIVLAWYVSSIASIFFLLVAAYWIFLNYQLHFSDTRRHYRLLINQCKLLLALLTLILLFQQSILVL